MATVEHASMNALLTDRHALAALAALLREGSARRRAVFEVRVRMRRHDADAVMTAGIGQVLRLLGGLRVPPAEIASLLEEPSLSPMMSETMLSYLREFRFTGDLDALPDGSLARDGEAVLRLRSTLAEAQLLAGPIVGLVRAGEARADFVRVPDEDIADGRLEPFVRIGKLLHDLPDGAREP